MNRFARVFTSLLAPLVFAAFPLAAGAVPPGTDQEIAERIGRVGTLCREGEDCARAGAEQPADADADERSGEAVYDQYCSTCHAAGVAGAPELGNAAAWEQRLAKGMDTLYEHSIEGINAMPPRGTCADCSDAEVRKAVDYMTDALE